MEGVTAEYLVAEAGGGCTGAITRRNAWYRPPIRSGRARRLPRQPPRSSAPVLGVLHACNFPRRLQCRRLTVEMVIGFRDRRTRPVRRSGRRVALMKPHSLRGAPSWPACVERAALKVGHVAVSCTGAIPDAAGVGLGPRGSGNNRSGSHPWVIAYAGQVHGAIRPAGARGGAVNGRDSDEVIGVVGRPLARHRSPRRPLAPVQFSRAPVRSG